MASITVGNTTEGAAAGTVKTIPFDCNGDCIHLDFTEGSSTSYSIVSVTYDGDSMTQTLAETAGSINIYHYRLVNPSQGTNNLVITISVDVTFNYSITALTNVDQSDPVAGNASETDTSALASVTPSGATLETITFDSAVGQYSLTASSGQTEVKDQGGSQHKSGYIAGEGDMEYTLSSGLWLIACTTYNANQVLVTVPTLTIEVTPQSINAVQNRENIHLKAAQRNTFLTAQERV